MMRHEEITERRHLSANSTVGEGVPPIGVLVGHRHARTTNLCKDRVGLTLLHLLGEQRLCTDLETCRF